MRGLWLTLSFMQSFMSLVRDAGIIYKSLHDGWCYCIIGIFLLLVAYK